MMYLDRHDGHTGMTFDKFVHCLAFCMQDTISGSVLGCDCGADKETIYTS